MLSFVHQSIATTRGRPASLAEEQDEGTPEFPISFHCLGVHEGEKDRKQDSYKINDPSSLELDILFIRGGVINQEPLHYNKNRPRRRAIKQPPWRSPKPPGRISQTMAAFFVGLGGSIRRKRFRG